MALNNSLATLAQKNIDSWAQDKPEMTYQEYRKSIGSNDSISTHLGKQNWNDYYNKYHRDQHIAFKIRSLTKHPHLLVAFLNEFSSFDWVDVMNYMKSVNWMWSDNECTPTIKELKDCVITLIPEDDYDNINNCIMSGGFEVFLYYLNGKSVCNIKFNKK